MARQEIDDKAGTRLEKSICRICTNYCAIEVLVRDGKAVEVRGDKDDPLFAGFTCVKGRAQPDYLSSPKRILKPLKKVDGGFIEVPMSQALDEIAAKLSAIVTAHGPRAVASWAGTMQTASKATSVPLLTALMDAIGSPFRFDPNTIDKGGKQIAAALHGHWQALPYGFDDPQAILFVGINPLVTCTGLPAGNPGTWLKQAMKGGTKLVVIDPRRTEVAARATVHLQPRPGFDAEVLAAMVHTVIAEGLHDRDFVAENVSGFDDLSRELAPFTPEAVGALADCDPQAIRQAARIYATAPRAYGMAGTGPHMALSGALTEYLMLCLDSLCGNWLRAGDKVRVQPVLMPERQYRAQAISPTEEWAKEERFVRGLRQSVSGMPAAALIDHMLPHADPRFRALISFAGNPAIAMPDSTKAARGLQSLDLLVQIDPWMSATAQHAHYVLPPLMPLEIPGNTFHLDSASGRATGYGMGETYARHTPAIVDPPEGADLLEEWRMFAGIAARMNLKLELRNVAGKAFALPAQIDTEGLTALFLEGSRVPLAEVEKARGGALFGDAKVLVAPKAEGWTGRLCIGSPIMLGDLALRKPDPADATPSTHGEYPFRLLCRRARHVYNSSCNVPATHRGTPHNPAFLHPDDLAALGIGDGDWIEIVSEMGRVPALARTDPALRRGLVSMSWGFGGIAGEGPKAGSNINLLTSNDVVFDRYTGQPLMSNVPVRVESGRL